MAKRLIDIGTKGNDGTGDSIRDAFRKVNQNFDELYASFGISGGLKLLDLTDTPDTVTPADANKILGVNAVGTGFNYKNLVAGSNVTLTKTNDQITINSTGGSIAVDLAPQLGGPLYASASNYPIGGLPKLENLTEYADALDIINDAHSISLDPDRFAANKGYVDTKVAKSGDSMSGVLNITNTTGSTGTTSGALKVTGGVGIQGALWAQSANFVSNATSPDPTLPTHLANKNYVDNNSFASAVELFVSTSGRTESTQLTDGVPSNKVGRAWAYAFNSILEAAQYAEAVINSSSLETGPYRQLITDNNATGYATVDPSGINADSIVLVHIGDDVDQVTDLLPGKLIYGNSSGAKGIITAVYTSEQDPVTYSNSNRIEFTPLTSDPFEPNEYVEFGEPVEITQISINVESGIYEEDYPIKLANNVSIVGTDFRRVIIRPKDRISQSPYAQTWFWRDTTFDGLTIASQNYGYHYLTDPNDKDSTPKNNKELDVFLCNDATRVHAVTVQGHGGFMMVLDPSGSILTKSPYCQVGSSFSRGDNEKAFRGGQYIDGFCGRIPAQVTAKTGNWGAGTPEVLTVQLNPSPYTFLEYREPKAPFSFYINGVRYQIDQTENYNSLTGTVDFKVNRNTSFGLSLPQTITIETPGNRSMLANDFTQVNDLGYGIVAANNGLTEQVSTFTYYCHTGFYALNGGQIRSVNGSSAHGFYGLKAEGSDPNEIPDPIVLEDNMIQVAQVYSAGDFSSSSAGVNQQGDISIIIYNYEHIPYSTSELEIHHGNSGPTRYVVNNIEMVTDGSNPSIPLAKINLRSDGTTAEGQVLSESCDHNEYVIIRSNQNFKFREIEANAPTRPSTALDFTYDTSDTIYRTITFDSNYYNNDLIPSDPTYGQDDNLKSDTAVVEFDATFDYVAMRVVNQNALAGATQIRIEGLAGDDPDRLNSGIMEFAWVDRWNSSTNSNVPPITKGFKRTITSYLPPGTDPGESGSNDYAIININSALPANTRIAIGEDIRAGLKKSPTTYLTTTAIPSSGSISTINANDTTGFTPTGSFIINLTSQISNIAKSSDIVTVTTSANHYLSAGDVVEVICVEYPEINIGKATVLSSGLTSTQFKYSQVGSAISSTAATGTANKRNNEVFNYTGKTGTSFTGVTRGAYGTTNSAYPIGSSTEIAQVAAEVTVDISTCRATGHDFLDIGTGGFNTTNYPNLIFGQPEVGFEPVSADDAVDDSGGASKAQTQEKSKGRVFFMGTDQDGFFRVGRFFEVDQGTGTVTFSAQIALSNLDGFGFKRGTVVREFSTDDSMGGTLGGAGDTVPTESAVRTYINRRLGLNSNGVTNTVVPNKIGPGFFPLDGSVPFSGNVNMGNFNIISLADPRVGSGGAGTWQPKDGATAGWVQSGAMTLTNKTIAAGSNTITGLTTSNLSATAGITNGQLANSSITVAGTSVSLGGSVSISTSNVSEGTNLYYTDSRARGSLSFTAGSGAYNSGTGVITIPTNTNQLTNGAGFITGYTETSTLNDVVGRGSTTASGISVGSITTTTVTTGGSSTAGTLTGTWSLSSGSSLQATYADLAEKYTADQTYDPGTVLVFGGVGFETTTTDQFGDHRVAGVVTTNPAYIMNKDLTGTVACIALQGRTPCKVLGRVKKGDLLVTSAKPGYAIVNNHPRVGTVIGKSLADKLTDGEGIIEVAVGRF